MSTATILIVPGLRDQVATHWQTLLEQDMRAAGRAVACVAPMGRADLNRASKVAAVEAAVQAIAGPIVLVAHSGGCIMVAHWAAQTSQAGRIRGALLAAPPDFEAVMPPGYPTLDELRAGHWMPVPLGPLPFPSLVAGSRNDPLCRFERAALLARSWGGRFIDVGAVGHLNPAAGYGPWPPALAFIDELCSAPAAAR